jgi:hypothetical protein
VSQAAALAELDAELHGAFADAGLADTGLYTPPPPHPLPPDYEPPEPLAVAVYLDRSSQAVGAAGQAVVSGTRIGIILAGVLPRQGGTVAIDGGATWRLGELQDNDGSIATFAAAGVVA